MKNNQFKSTRNFLTAAFLIFLMVIITGCSAKSTPTSAATTISSSGTTAVTTATTPPTVSYIIITESAQLTLQVGATHQYDAVAAMSDGTTKDITTTGSWASSDSTVAAIAQGGLVTAIAPGQIQITVSISGVTSGTETILVKPAGPLLTTIAVSRDVISNLTVGDKLQLKATGTFADGTMKDISAAVTWTSSDPTKATVSATGLVTALAAGKTTVTATDIDISSVGIVLTIEAP